VTDGHEVRAFDDLSDGSLDNLADAPEVELVEGDLRNRDAVRAAAEGAHAIFHQGAKRSVPRSILEPGLTTEVNVGGTLNVLLAAREVGARVVAASSSSVYGDQDRFPQEESMSPRPKSPYAASKAAGEAYCLAIWTSMGVPAISLRYFNVYGPGQDPNSEYAAVVPRFITACLNGVRPVIHGDGEQARDFTFVDDIIEANVMAAQAGEEAFGKAFNIGGGGEPTSINELLGLIAELTGTSPDPAHEPSRDGDVRMTYADVSRARAALGYEPRVPIREGLRRTLEAFRASA
jgi:UDP-N-acetylglucosamine/UDP-N-acetyl-alpha-D-glucosaminouronate 4-epimerase